MNSYFSKKYYWIVCISTLLIGNSQYASAYYSYWGHWWVSAEAGAALALNDTFIHTAPMPNDPLPPLYDDYKTKQRDTGYLLGITVGYEWECMINCHVGWWPSMRLGIGYELLGSTDISGDIIKYQELEYYDFHYRTWSQVIWVDAQVDLFTLYGFTPFVDVAIGPSFNRAYDYDESRISGDVPVRGSADFEDKVSVALAWRAGLGINYGFDRLPWDIDFVVRYSDLGDARTGESQTYPSVGALKLPIQNLELLFALRYNF